MFNILIPPLLPPLNSRLISVRFYGAQKISPNGKNGECGKVNKSIPGPRQHKLCFFLGFLVRHLMCFCFFFSYFGIVLFSHKGFGFPWAAFLQLISATNGKKNFFIVLRETIVHTREVNY